MVRSITRIFSRLAGGRPMTLFGIAFIDVVSHKPVFRALDRNGDWWLANGRWSLFRVKIEGYK